jgi:hypothetical protein
MNPVRSAGRPTLVAFLRQGGEVDVALHSGGGKILSWRNFIAARETVIVRAADNHAVEGPLPFNVGVLVIGIPSTLHRAGFTVALRAASAPDDNRIRSKQSPPD